MSETFTFDVHYATTFEDLEKLRDKMIAFLKTERRDYQAVFDLAVVGSFLLAPADLHVRRGCADDIFLQISRNRKKWC